MMFRWLRKGKIVCGKCAGCHVSAQPAPALAAHIATLRGKEEDTKKVKQISVSLENKPGNLPLFCRRLGARNINIIAISVVENELHNHNVVRMVVDNPSAALRILDQWRLAYEETDALLADLPNSNSALAELASKPTLESISVDFTYISASPDRQKSYIVIGTPDVEVAMRELSLGE